MATAFGPEGCLIIHWLAAIAPRTFVFNLETGYQFPETLRLRDQIARRYGIEVAYEQPATSVDDYERLGSLVQMNPSIKNKADNEELWKALLDGTIEVIATDHAPHTLEEKNQPYPLSPSGLPAVENSMALMLNSVNQGRCTLQQVVSWMCEAPAKIWNIVNKGRIQVGYDADLVLVDMNRTIEVRNEDQVTKSGWTPWHGETLKGWPVRTIVGGRTVFNDGQFDESVRGSEAKFGHSR